MDYTHKTLILPSVEWLRLYKYAILLLVEPVFEVRNSMLFFVKTIKKRNFTGKQVVFKKKKQGSIINAGVQAKNKTKTAVGDVRDDC